MWKIIDLFFPPRCIVCDGLLKPAEQGVCARCEPLLKKVGSPYCMKWSATSQHHPAAQNNMNSRNSVQTV